MAPTRMYMETSKLAGGMTPFVDVMRCSLYAVPNEDWQSITLCYYILRFVSMMSPVYAASAS